MHNIKLIRRRFPNQQNKIVWILVILSLLGVLLGIGLVILL